MRGRYKAHNINDIDSFKKFLKDSIGWPSSVDSEAVIEAYFKVVDNYWDDDLPVHKNVAVVGYHLSVMLMGVSQLMNHVTGLTSLHIGRRNSTLEIDYRDFKL